MDSVLGKYKHNTKKTKKKKNYTITKFKEQISNLRNLYVNPHLNLLLNKLLQELWQGEVSSLDPTQLQVLLQHIHHERHLGQGTTDTLLEIHVGD